MKLQAILSLLFLFFPVCYLAPARFQDYQAALQPAVAHQHPPAQVLLNFSPWLVLLQGTMAYCSLLTSGIKAYQNLRSVVDLMINHRLDFCLDIGPSYWHYMLLSALTLAMQSTTHAASRFVYNRPISWTQLLSSILPIAQFCMLLFWNSSVGEESAIDGANLMLAGQSNLAMTFAVLILFILDYMWSIV